MRIIVVPHSCGWAPATVAEYDRKNGGLVRQFLHFAYGFVSRREFHRHRSYNRSVALSLAPRVISRTNDCGDHAPRFHSFDGVMAKAPAGASNACRDRTA
jgi:hypothetical protein